MSDKIGVLGSNTATALGTATGYLVPTSKAAKVKIFYVAQANAAGTSTLTVLVNNIPVFTTAALTASNFIFSVRGAGLTVAPQAALPTGQTVATTIAPADQTFQLSAGQSVSYTVGGSALISMNFQVIGTEIDV